MASAAQLKDQLMRPKTLFNLLNVFKQMGKGERVMKTKWKGYNSFYTITDVEQINDKEAIFYGIKTWGGISEERPHKVISQDRRDWVLFFETSEKLKPLSIYERTMLKKKQKEQASEKK